MSLYEALNNVSKKYVCNICGSEHDTHREAVKCADECLAKEQRDSDKVQKVEK